MSSSSFITPRDRRLEEIWKKLNDDDILRRIPKRISPDVEFSEDEDEESEGSSSEDFTDEQNSDCDCNVITPFKSSYDGNSVQGPLECSSGKPMFVSKRVPLQCLYSVHSVDNPSLMFKKPSLDSSTSHSEDFKQVYSDTLERIAQLSSKTNSNEKKENFLFLNQKSACKKKNEVKTTGSNNLISLNSIGLPEENDDKDKKLLFINNKVYELLSLLGSGGSCKVYSAIEGQTRNVLAIKCVNLDKGDEAMANGFMKEIEYLKSLQGSDHVIKLYDYEYHNNQLFLVLEKGDIDLAHYLSDEKKKQNLTPIMIKFYWAQMLKAVADIHMLGIVHSDLKPANFLLVSGHLKLIDFGIATSVPKDKTSVLRENQIGTVNYMSPEAVKCHTFSGNDGSGDHPYVYKVSFKSDVWSLGCILYDMVYGHTPFANVRSLLSKVHAIVNPGYQIPFPPIKDNYLLDVLKLCLVRDLKKRASVQDLLNHPYLTREVESLVVPENVNELLSRIQTLTPRRMSAVSEVVKKLSMNN